jgi:glucose-1-phosphate cytidylyltransferase
MKAVIFAGGLGSRLSEETSIKPKPMIEIGNQPLLWHIMKIYSHYGINDFIICCGYKSEKIKEYFLNFLYTHSDFTISYKNERNNIKVHKKDVEDWNVTLVDTGLDTMTAGRLKSVEPYIDSDDFCLTYGDGLSDININQLISFHRASRKMATITAIKPKGRFGAMVIKDDAVISFKEKISNETDYINGGFFVLNKTIFSILSDIKISEPLEGAPIQKLVESNEIAAYQHNGFWQSMDTMKEKKFLNELWIQEKAPWKIW